MSFKTCRQLIHEDFRKVLTQQPHGKISEYLYILRYLITNNSFKFLWGIERSGFFNDREKWVKSFENQRV